MVWQFLNLQIGWDWKLWHGFHGKQDAEQKDAISIFELHFKTGLGSCVESQGNWDWGGSENWWDGDSLPLAVRGRGGLQLLLFRCFAKENNQTKEYSVIGMFNEDGRMGRPQRRLPTYNLLPLKKTRAIWKGDRVPRQKWGRGIFQLSEKVEKH